MVLTNTALDIMSPGLDRDSGAGVVMAPVALQAVEPDLTKFADNLNNSSPHVGDTITASLTMTNEHCGLFGNSVGPFHVGFYFSTSSTFSGATPFYEGSIAGCSVNGSVSFTNRILVSGVSPGTYYLGYKIDEENEITECNENNNGIYYWTVTVTQSDITPPTISITSPTTGALYST